MTIDKKILKKLTKCYSIAPLTYEGKAHFLVAAEKQDACCLFDINGNFKQNIWDAPGGTMSMVQIPNTNGQFLAVQRFYSPNDSKDAEIVWASPKTNGEWEIKTLVKLPHVHRFDIVTRNNINYIIACTIKSGHEFKDDWSKPGKVYAAILPENLNEFSFENQLKLNVIQSNLLKNHGYYRAENELGIYSLIFTHNGIFKFLPPKEKGMNWEITEILDRPASDGILIDIDEDNEEELAVFSPFHGDDFSIYKKIQNIYECVYTHENKLEFTHAICKGIINGKPTVIVGHRKGARDLLGFTYNKESKSFESFVIDKDCGPANVFCFENNDKSVIISANREIDEIAMYTIWK